MKKLHIWFIAGSLFFFVVSSVAFYMEHHREWKNYQCQYRTIEYEKTKSDYANALKSFTESGNEEKCKVLQAEIRDLRKAFDQQAYRKAVTAFKEAQDVNDRLEKKLKMAMSEWKAAEYELHNSKYPKGMEVRVKGLEKEVSLLETELNKTATILNEKQEKMTSFTEPIKIKEKELVKLRNEYKLNWYESRLTEIRPGFLDKLRNFMFVDFLHPTDKINQIYLSGLGQRVDRCTTCHMSIDRSGFEKINRLDIKKIQHYGFKNDGLPFTTHSNYDLIIKNHPPEQFGCTICHQGQGRATKGKAARGDVPHWEDPLLPAKYIESSCGKCHFGLDKLEGAPSLSSGRELFQKNKCFECHTIDREDLRAIATSTIGPPLTEIGSKRVHDLNWGTVTNIPRTKWDWHFAHLKNPKQFTPDTEMPTLGLTDEEAEALVNFVLSFTDEKIDNEYIVRPKIPQETITVSVDMGQNLDSALDEL